MRLITYTLLSAAIVIGGASLANAQSKVNKTGTPVEVKLEKQPVESIAPAVAQPEVKPAEGTSASSLTFNKTEHDFGTVKQSDEGATYIFTFTNTGKDPIAVTNVIASCGCTTPEYSTEPVLPGKTGSIKVIYGTKGRPGAFNKNVSVNSTGGNQLLKIKGIVE